MHTLPSSSANSWFDLLPINALEPIYTFSFISSILWTTHLFAKLEKPAETTIEVMRFFLKLHRQLLQIGKNHTPLKKKWVPYIHLHNYCLFFLVRKALLLIWILDTIPFTYKDKKRYFTTLKMKKRLNFFYFSSESIFFRS